MALGNYDPIIAQAAKRFGVPEARIRAVMQVESGGKPNATSRKGAGGLMQIMPGTYEDLRRQFGLGDDRYDPHNNIMGGTAYMRQMYDQFGNWDDALGAYNAGPGRMREVKAGRRGLPAETKNYVPQVNARLGEDVAFNPTIPTLQRPRPGQVVAKPGYIPEHEQELRGLLDLEVPSAGNQADGLGSLLGVGQTPSQEPGPSIGGRIDGLIDQLSQPVDRSNRMGVGGMMMQGALSSVLPLAGERGRKVGIGELLGSLGSGLTRGSAAFQQQQKDDRTEQFAELGGLTKLQTYQRGEVTAANKVEAARRWAAAERQSGDPNRIAMANAVEKDPSLLDGIITKQAEYAYPKNEETPLVKNARAAGLVPGTPAWNKFIQENAAGGTRINLNTTENRAANALAEGRVKRYEEVRGRGENAGKMLSKLDQLEAVLTDIGNTGPGTPAVSKIIGWARQAGIPTEQINEFYQQWTGNNLADPSKVDLAQKLIQDFVTGSIKTLGANPTDTDLATLQQANPSITNQADANMYIIRNSLRPQLQYDRDLWNDVRGIDRTDQTLDTLEDRIHAFEQKKAQEKAAAEKQKASPEPSPEAKPGLDAGKVKAQYPDAVQMKDGRWAAPDPTSKTGWRLIVPK